MVIAKELEWTRDYLEAVRHMLPKLKLVRRLSIKKANKRQIQRVHGVCTNYTDKRHYKICLYVTKSSVESRKPLKVVIKMYSKMELLRVLAHELAHLEHWPHTPDHEALTCSIMIVFMTLLKAEGYISEEHEEKLVKGFKIS